LEKRVCQGSSGTVYPHPVIEKNHDEKTDKEWDVIYLENDYPGITLDPDKAYLEIKGQLYNRTPASLVS
jgi:hypothetical protein